MGLQYYKRQITEGNTCLKEGIYKGKDKKGSLIQIGRRLNTADISAKENGKKFHSSLIM